LHSSFENTECEGVEDSTLGGELAIRMWARGSKCKPAKRVVIAQLTSSINVSA